MKLVKDLNKPINNKEICIRTGEPGPQWKTSLSGNVHHKCSVCCCRNSAVMWSSSRRRHGTGPDIVKWRSPCWSGHPNLYEVVRLCWGRRPQKTTAARKKDISQNNHIAKLICPTRKNDNSRGWSKNWCSLSSRNIQATVRAAWVAVKISTMSKQAGDSPL